MMHTQKSFGYVIKNRHVEIQHRAEFDLEKRIQKTSRSYQGLIDDIVSVHDYEKSLAAFKVNSARKCFIFPISHSLEYDLHHAATTRNESVAGREEVEAFPLLPAMVPFIAGAEIALHCRGSDTYWVEGSDDDDYDDELKQRVKRMAEDDNGDYFVASFTWPLSNFTALDGVEMPFGANAFANFTSTTAAPTTTSQPLTKRERRLRRQRKRRQKIIQRRKQRQQRRKMLQMVRQAQAELEQIVNAQSGVGGVLGGGPGGGLGVGPSSVLTGGTTNSGTVSEASLLDPNLLNPFLPGFGGRFPGFGRRGGYGKRNRFPVLTALIGGLALLATNAVAFTNGQLCVNVTLLFRTVERCISFAAACNRVCGATGG